MCKTIEEQVLMTQHELRRWRMMLRWFVALGSTLMLISGSMFFSVAQLLRLELANAKRVPVEAIMIDHEAQSAAGALKPGELVITRKPDGTMTTNFTAHVPDVKNWRLQ